MIKKLIKKTATLVEYPVLIRTIFNKMNRGFVKNLLIVKEKFKVYPKTIFDIGGATGEWTNAAKFVFPHAQIYFFEPIPDSIMIAKQKLLRYKNINFYNYALYSENGIKEFYLNEFSYSSSLLKMTNLHKEIFPFTKNERIIKVQTKRLDSVESIVFNNPVFIKIDVQGAEIEVLKGFGQKIKNVDAVEIELNFELFYENQPSVKDIFHFFLR